LIHLGELGYRNGLARKAEKEYAEAFYHVICRGKSTPGDFPQRRKKRCDSQNGDTKRCGLPLLVGFKRIGKR
jgi:hypothetical protein